MANNERCKRCKKTNYNFMYAVVACNRKKTIMEKKRDVGTNATNTYINQL